MFILGVKCTVKSNGIECGSCPAGMTGDGKKCQDIDEVTFKLSPRVIGEVGIGQLKT